MLIRITVIALVLFCSCKKYKDPAPFTDPRLTNHYCNDPSAVNFNWDFPGIPDNSVCFYPAQMFNGQYTFYDTIVDLNGDFLINDSFLLTFQQIDSVKLSITGFCGANKHYARANRYLLFTFDTLVGNGQILCDPQDTISGGGSKFNTSDTVDIIMNYQVNTDTGITIHKGRAVKN